MLKKLLFLSLVSFVLGFPFHSYSQTADPIIVNNQCFMKLTTTFTMKVDPLKECYGWYKQVIIPPHSTYTLNVPFDKCDYEISGPGKCVGLKSGTQLNLKTWGDAFLKTCVCSN